MQNCSPCNPAHPYVEVHLDDLNRTFIQVDMNRIALRVMFWDMPSLNLAFAMNFLGNLR